MSMSITVLNALGERLDMGERKLPAAPALFSGKLVRIGVSSLLVGLLVCSRGMYVWGGGLHDKIYAS